MLNLLYQTPAPVKVKTPHEFRTGQRFFYPLLSACMSPKHHRNKGGVAKSILSRRSESSDALAAWSFAVSLRWALQAACPRDQNGVRSRAARDCVETALRLALQACRCQVRPARPGLRPVVRGHSPINRPQTAIVNSRSSSPTELRVVAGSDENYRAPGLDMRALARHEVSCQSCVGITRGRSLI
jgi:hypothetical protein